MKKLIKKYVNLQQTVIQEAGAIKKKHKNTSIRIGVHYNTSADNGVDYYYYDPGKEEVYEGASLISNSSHYSYKNIGDIEIIVFRNYENDYIRISRIIRPRHEDMNYADQYEKPAFDHDYSEEEWQKLNEEEMKNHDKYSRIGASIIKCINCGKQFLSQPQTNYNTELVETGEVCFLNEGETELICRNCTENTTIGAFLESIDNENARDKYRSCLLRYYGLGKDEKIFL